MPPPNIASHFCVRSVASHPAKGERSGNKSIFRASPTPSGSSVWKVSTTTMTVSAWGIHGGQKCRFYAVFRQAASIAARALSFSSRAMVLQMFGICHVVLELQIRRRLCRSAPHCSAGVTACLVGAGVGAGACIWKGCCSRIFWIRVCICKFGGTRLVLIPCICVIMASVRSTLVRAAMPCRGSIVATPDQSRNSSTHWVIPVASALAYIIYHTVASSRKGETISGWTRERGARDDRGTETLSVIGVFWGRWGCPGARSANKTYISAAGGISTSTGVSHSVCTTTVAAREGE